MKTNLRKKLAHTLLVTPLCLTFFLFALKSEALTVQEVPNPRQVYGGWVTDQAEILSDSTETQLNQMITELEAKNGSEIAVVTVTETDPSSLPKAFAIELFNYWGIGKKGQDNGVLFLISVDDRRVEIETGYGVESILPDAKVGNIINTEITPRYKQGDFNNGTLAGTKALVAVLAGATVEDSNQYTSTQKITSKVHWHIYLATGGLVLTVITYGLAMIASKEMIDKKSLFIKPVGISRIFLSSFMQNLNNLDKSVYLLSYLGSFSLVFSLMLFLLVNTNLTALIVYSVAGLIAGLPVSYVVSGTIKKKKQRTFRCSDCQEPMKKLNFSTVSSCLNKPEQVASQLGSVNFEGWQCPNCRSELNRQGIHIFAYIVDSDNFHQCPNCQEQTVKRTRKILKKATQYSSGKRLIIDKCHCCDYRQETEETIPPLPPRSPRGSSSFFGGGGFGGGGSSGGGGFGGGSSGGGGAGGDW